MSRVLLVLIDKWNGYIDNLKGQIDAAFSRQSYTEATELTRTMVAYQVCVDDLCVVLDLPKQYGVEDA